MINVTSGRPTRLLHCQLRSATVRRTDVVDHAPGEASAPRRAVRSTSALNLLSLRDLKQFRAWPRLALGFVIVSALAMSFGPGVSGTEALFVAIVRNAGNTFGVPSILAPTNVGATPQTGGSIRIQWTEPGASNVSPIATSWAGTYFVYRSDSPATPAAGATPYATVLSSGASTGTFVDGGPVNGQECTGANCPVNNTRYYYWVRALSRQTGFPSPFISATVSAASDSSAPTVLSVSPGTNATSVPLTTNVQITFSEPVDFNAAVAATCIAKASTPASCIAVTANQSRWTKSSGVLLELKPTERLAANTAYAVSFIASGTFGVRDLAGNVMSAVQASDATKFTTETPAGTVGIRWRSPAVDSQEYMPASGPVVALAFAEPMEPTSTASAFKLFAGAGCPSGGAVATTAAWNATSNAVTFSPNSPLSVGLMASPTFGVYTYSMQFNAPQASASSASNNPASPIQCANGSFVPSSAVLAVDLADIPSGASIAEPMVVAGEPLVLRSASGPWRQGSYRTLRSLFDEPRTANVVSNTFTITGDTWSGLPLTVPADAANGRHFIAVQNDALAANIGQDVRTAVKAVTVVDPTITVTTYGAADSAEASPRTVMSPLAASNGDTLRFRAQVTAPGRDGNGVRPVVGISVRVRALANPVGYGASLCATLTNSICNGNATDLLLTTDSQGVVRGFLTAPMSGAPFNTIVLLASAGTEWGSLVLTDPAPVPPSALRYIANAARFSWSASPTPGVAGYRVRLVPVGVPGAVDIVIDAGTEMSVSVPTGVLLPGRTYRGSVTAYDSIGRTSSNSEEISFVAPMPTETPTSTVVATATSSATFVMTVTATVSATPGTPTATAPGNATATQTAAVGTVTATPISAGGSAVTPTPLASVAVVTTVPSSASSSGVASAPTNLATPTIESVTATAPGNATPTNQGALPPSTSPNGSVPTATPGSTVIPAASPTTALSSPTVVWPTNVAPTVMATASPNGLTSSAAPTSTSVVPPTVVPVATPAPPSPTTAPSAGTGRQDGVTTW